MRSMSSPQASSSAWMASWRAATASCSPYADRNSSCARARRRAERAGAAPGLPRGRRRPLAARRQQLPSARVPARRGRGAGARPEGPERCRSCLSKLCTHFAAHTGLADNVHVVRAGEQAKARHPAAPPSQAELTQPLSTGTRPELALLGVPKQTGNTLPALRRQHRLASAMSGERTAGCLLTQHAPPCSGPCPPARGAHPHGARRHDVKLLRKVRDAHVGLLLGQLAGGRLQVARDDLQLRRLPRAVDACRGGRARPAQ